MAEHQLPKLTVRVRFPSSAPKDHPRSGIVSRKAPAQLRLGRTLHGPTTFGEGRDLRCTSRTSTAAAIASSATRLLC
jgi:hypothetical protein